MESEDYTFELSEEHAKIVLKIANEFSQYEKCVLEKEVESQREEKIVERKAPPKAQFPENGYKGFLIIRCSSCGKIKGFNQKTLTRKYRCACGRCTRLENLKPVYLECDNCGESLKYRTNIDDEAFEYPCLECGSPVHLILNRHKTAYATSPNPRL